MNLSMLAPPNPTGDTKKDVEELRKWCQGLYSQLRRILYNLDSGNINEVTGDTIVGEIDLSNASLKGARVNIGNDTFSITNSDGSQYLKLTGDTLSFCGKVTEL